MRKGALLRDRLIVLAQLCQAQDCALFAAGGGDGGWDAGSQALIEHLLGDTAVCKAPNPGSRSWMLAAGQRELRGLLAMRACRSS